MIRSMQTHNNLFMWKIKSAEEWCYKCIKIDKTEQDWSFNQFAMHASEYFA